MGRGNESSPDIVTIVEVIISIVIVCFVIWFFFLGGMQVVAEAAPPFTK